MIVDVLHVDSRLLDSERRSRLLAVLASRDGNRWMSLRPGEGRDGVMFAHALGILLAAERCRCSPVDVRIAHNGAGRPILVLPYAHSLDISLTHGDGFAAAAVVADLIVGIDGERIERQIDVARVATVAPMFVRYVMSRREFLARWTTAEAIAKASGIGLKPLLVDEHSRVVSEWETHTLQTNEGVLLSIAYPRTASAHGDSAVSIRLASYCQQ